MVRLPSLTTTHYWWLAILWTAGIVVAFSLPPTSLSSVQPALSYDKIAHISLFAGFGALWMRVLCPPADVGDEVSLGRRALQFVLLGGLFAGGSELYQGILPIQRMVDPYDFLADGVGLLLGIGAYVFYVRRGGPNVPSSEASS